MDSSMKYPSEHLRRLYNMQELNQLCDVTIHVGGQKFRAHKAVLAASGDYFLTMFTSGFRESSAPEISIEGSAAAFEVLLHFVYTGRVIHTEVAFCIYNVLEMACYMQLREFALTCSAAIRKLLKTATEDFSVTDVCKVMLLAQTHDYLSSLYKATLEYLENKVESLKSLDLFLENVSATFLQDFLSRENLSTAEEEQHVLELAVNWLKHDWEKRKGHSCQLLKRVRLGLVASEDIKKLIGPEILEIPGCFELVNRVLDLEALQKPKEMMVIENPDIAASRSNIMAPVIMNNGEVNYFDEKLKRWISMEKMDPLPSKSRNTHFYELIVVKGVLYAAGGTNGKEFLKYQASDNKWLPLPSKPLGKNRLKLVTFGDYIYAFGACCAPRDEVIERYDINAEKWEVLKKVESDISTRRFTKLVAEEMDSTETTDNCHCRNHHGSTQDYEKRDIFAVVFESNIFVSSLHQKLRPNLERIRFYLEEELVIFDPALNTYQVKALDSSRREERRGHWDEFFFKPTLFVYKDQLYRMISKLHPEMSPVVASKLSLAEEEDGTMKVQLGAELRDAMGYSQLDLHEMPDDEGVPFYIQDKIFVTRGERASKKDGQMSGHDEVKSFPQYRENKLLMHSNYDITDCIYPMWFSFEKKKLTIPKVLDRYGFLIRK